MWLIAKVARLQYFWIRATEDGTGIRFQLGRRPHDKVGDILFWRKWDGGRVGFICITVRHAQMKYIKKFAHAIQYNIILLFTFSILLIALSIAKVIVWSHWQCNFLVIRLFDHQIGWSLLPILLSCTFVHRSYQRQESHLARLAKSHGANYGKPKPGSESEKRSIAYQVDY